MSTSSWIWILVVVIILLGGGWYFLSQAPASVIQNTENNSSTPIEPAPTTSDSSMGEGVGDASDTFPMEMEVLYDANGFSPQEVTIKVGGTVTWTNTGSGNMWVASAQHPTHTTYAGTSLSEHCDDATDVSFDQCENSATYSFTFDKVGTWGYHNHSNASHFGRVIVVE